MRHRSLQRLPNGDGLPLPSYATPSAPGSICGGTARRTSSWRPATRAWSAPAFAIALPAEFEAQVRPRSGLALKAGVTVLNSPGTIDADYRGEIGVILINHGDDPFTVRRGDRIAQLVIAPIARAAWQVTAELPPSERGAADSARPALAGERRLIPWNSPIPNSNATPAT